MTKWKTFAQRLVRPGDRFQLDSSLLALLEPSGVKNAAIRAHPCTFQLPSLHLPERLDRAAIEVLKEVDMTPESLTRRSNMLNNYLWQRPLPVEKLHRRELYRRFEASQLPNNATEDDVAEFDLTMRTDKREISRLVERQLAEWRPIRYSPRLAPIYLVGRLAPNFAISCRVLYEIRKRCPEFAPRSLYDFGSGLGTAVWAANSVWSDGSLQETMMVDSSSAMLNLAEQLQRDGRASPHTDGCFPGVHSRQFLSASPQPAFDLVVSACTLLDLGFASSRNIALETLWRKTSGFLVLLEPGNTAGFNAILEARDFLLKNFGPDAGHDPKEAAHLFAPCPHAQSCPKQSSICNFYVSYKKFNLTTTREDYAKELFSYIIFSKGPPSPGPTTEVALPRIISYKPRKTKHYILHDVCSPKGDAERVVFSRKNCNKFMYAMMTRAVAGDLVPAEMKPEEPGGGKGPQEENLESDSEET